MLDHYQPVGQEQTDLFDDMFSAFWRMRRAQNLEQALFGLVITEQEWWARRWDAIDLKHNPNIQDEGKSQTGEALKVDLNAGLNRAAKAFKGQSDVFQTLSQYEARLSRQYLRYRKELRALQAKTQTDTPTVGQAPTNQAPKPLSFAQPARRRRRQLRPPRSHPKPSQRSRPRPHPPTSTKQPLSASLASFRQVLSTPPPRQRRACPSASDAVDEGLILNPC
jgi:hypothetical protein